MVKRIINRILLGLLMLVPGIAKLWGLINPGDKGWFVPSMLSQIGFPAPIFFAWVLMLSEIVFGIAILASWKLKYTVWPPIIILLVAALTLARNNPANLLLHLVAIANLWLLGSNKCKDECCCMHGKTRYKKSR
ncbi:MAG TPA: DoxX family protein [Candidatus Nanoarchaeia archaeon]|nr:DoxX family protein [Candidatus Nanoarchaeia archaeon]